jgi:FkbM family methyltransferase
MYSQNNEEKIITDFFGNFIGQFLDIGAHNGKLASNTYRLSELKWEGVCIEPSPSVYPKLKELHGPNEKIILCPKAIGLKSGRLKFYDSGGDMLSTFSEEHKEKWEKGWPVKFQEVIVDTITVKEMFEEFGTNFSFINLDVEGCSWELFESFDLNILPELKLLCIEHDSCIEDIKKKCNPFGFVELDRNGENLILGR